MMDNHLPAPERRASRVGQLEGNHFLTIRDPLGELAEVGRHLMWEGALPLSIEVTGP